eukprot:1154890-Pelagomonas_calceolata.AAC.1
MESGVQGWCTGMSAGQHDTCTLALTIQCTDYSIACMLAHEWSFANENKTSWMKTEPFVAAGSMQEAVELRRYGGVSKTSPQEWWETRFNVKPLCIRIQEQADLNSNI